MTELLETRLNKVLKEIDKTEDLDRRKELLNEYVKLSEELVKHNELGVRKRIELIKVCGKFGEVMLTAACSAALIRLVKVLEEDCILDKKLFDIAKAMFRFK